MSGGREVVGSAAKAAAHQVTNRGEGGTSKE